MSLIFCPECKKQISDKSANCPNCGYPINEANTPKIVLKQKEGCFEYRLLNSLYNWWNAFTWNADFFYNQFEQKN